MNETKLEHLAKLTIKELEQKLSRRGWTSGFKKWELQLLYLAYEGMETPVNDRKFKLNEVKHFEDIERKQFGNG